MGTHKDLSLMSDDELLNFIDGTNMGSPMSNLALAIYEHRLLNNLRLSIDRFNENSDKYSLLIIWLTLGLIFLTIILVILTAILIIKA